MTTEKKMTGEEKMTEKEKMTREEKTNKREKSGGGDATKSQGKGVRVVTRETLIGDLVKEHPQAALVMMQHGMHCVGCPMSAMESIEQGTVGHGMPEDVLEKLLKAINETITTENTESKEEKKRA